MGSGKTTGHAEVQIIQSLAVGAEQYAGALPSDWLAVVRMITAAKAPFASWPSAAPSSRSVSHC